MTVSNKVLIFKTTWKSSHELYKTYVIFISSKSSIFCYHWSSEKINIIFCYNFNWVKRWKEENTYIHIKYHTYIRIYIHNIHTWYTYMIYIHDIHTCINNIHTYIHTYITHTKIYTIDITYIIYIHTYKNNIHT